MMKLKITLLVLCLLILGAHFLRDGNTLAMLLSTATPFLLLIKKRWALTSVQIILVISAIIWIDTTYILIEQRMANGAPWIRMAAILVSVACLTLYSAIMLNSSEIKERYL